MTCSQVDRRQSCFWKWPNPFPYRAVVVGLGGHKRKRGRGAGADGLRVTMAAASPEASARFPTRAFAPGRFAEAWPGHCSQADAQPPVPDRAGSPEAIIAAPAPAVLRAAVVGSRPGAQLGMTTATPRFPGRQELRVLYPETLKLLAFGLVKLSS